MLYFYVSTAFFIGGMIIIYWLHNQHHLDIIVEQAPHPPHTPLISACIPARNEERNIRACVEAILAQDYPNFEVIVLDDRSTDATSSILADIASRDPRLKRSTVQTYPKAGPGNPMHYIKPQPLRTVIGFALLTQIPSSPVGGSQRVTPKQSRQMQICSLS